VGKFKALLIADKNLERPSYNKIQRY